MKFFNGLATGLPISIAMWLLIFMGLAHAQQQSPQDEAGAIICSVVTGLSGVLLSACPGALAVSTMLSITRIGFLALKTKVTGNCPLNKW